MSNNYQVLFFDKQRPSSNNYLDIRLLQPRNLLCFVRPIDYIHLRLFYASIYGLFVDNKLAGYVISYKYPFYRCGLNGRVFRELSFHVFDSYRGKRYCDALVKYAILANDNEGCMSYCFIKSSNFSSFKALREISFSSRPCTRTKRALVSRYKFDHNIFSPFEK